DGDPRARSPRSRPVRRRRWPWLRSGAGQRPRARAGDHERAGHCARRPLPDSYEPGRRHPRARLGAAAVNTAARRPRILIADDHKLVVEGLRKLLEKEFEVVGTVDNGRALLAAAERLKPAVILVDVSMP